MQPRFRCNRCMGTFEDNKTLVLHHRAPEPCPLREWVVLEGCSEEQKEKIRKGDKVRTTAIARRALNLQKTLTSYCA